MRFCIFFLIVGISCFFLSSTVSNLAQLFFIWAGLSFTVIAGAYVKFGPYVLGKKTSGEIALVNLIILWPYFFFVWTLWHCVRFLSRKDPYNELIPDIYIGRRLLQHEIPDDIDYVFDLTSEFFEPLVIRSQKKYFCLPILDASTPGEDDLRKLIQSINSCQGKVYIHCAEGHGRTGMVAASLLLSRGLASDVKDAIMKIKQKRTGISLQKKQREIVTRVYNISC